MKNLILLFVSSVLWLLMFWGCNQPSVQNGESENAPSTNSASAPQALSDMEDLVISRGEEISGEVQRLLITNLITAMEDSGVSYAVQFCSVKARPLTDSLAKNHGVYVRRISDKNRNPDNVANEQELAIMEDFRTKKEEGGETNPVVLEEAGHYRFYKPIFLPGQPCLRCHGQPELDINASDYITIQLLYPEDKATGYISGDLRGLWKIDFPKNTFLP